MWRYTQKLTDTEPLIMNEETDENLIKRKFDRFCNMSACRVLGEYTGTEWVVKVSENSMAGGWTATLYQPPTVPMHSVHWGHCKEWEPREVSDRLKSSCAHHPKGALPVCDKWEGIRSHFTCHLITDHFHKSRVWGGKFSFPF